jgi:hypothetical protein
MEASALRPCQCEQLQITYQELRVNIDIIPLLLVCGQDLFGIYVNNPLATVTSASVRRIAMLLQEEEEEV